MNLNGKSRLFACLSRVIGGVATLAMAVPLGAQVTMRGPKTVTPNRHDGGLRPVVGVQEHALFRPTHNTSQQAGPLEGHGVIHHTFHHHPFITYWNKRFWVYHIGFDVDEATKTGYLHWSEDGRTWNETDKGVLFPAPLASHQRLAFFTASNGRLLATTWHSKTGEAGRGGVGSRLVREIRGPGDFSTIHVLRHNYKGPAQGLGFPFYQESGDDGLKSACSELLSNRLYMQTMWEEEVNRQADSPYEIQPPPASTDFEGKAFSWYRLDHPKGRIVGNWKGGWFGISAGGEWKKADVRLDSDLNRFGEHRSAKMWGEPVSNGIYALFYSMGTFIHANPRPTYEDSRTPLVVATGKDGLSFSNGPFLISGDSGPQLYRNGKVDNKTTGASYVHGITWIANREDQKRFNDNVWITYSTNKEFIWVTEVPKEMTTTVTEQIDESFANRKPGDRVGNWNIRNGAWTPVRLVSAPSGTVLRLQDKDPFDYAKAFRVFPRVNQATITTTIMPKQSAGGELHVELVDATGNRPVRLRLANNSEIQRQDKVGTWHKIGTYHDGESIELALIIDTTTGVWSIYMNRQLLAENLPIAQHAEGVERIEFRTGGWRLDDFRTNNFGGRSPGFRQTDLDGAHDPVALAEFDVLSLRTSNHIQKPVANP